MMKHDIRITLMLVVFFLAAQYVGLFITQQYVTVEQTTDITTGRTSYNVTNVTDLPMGVERADVSEDYSWLYIMVAIFVGTALILLLARFKQKKVWKFWYFISLVFIMTFALYPFLGTLPSILLSVILATFKTYKQNFIIHNITEIFLYGGLAALLVPIMNIFSAFVLLVIIAIYDAIAVWKSKHMVTLAEFQSDSDVFAGLFIPYSAKHKKKPHRKSVPKRVSTAKRSSSTATSRIRRQSDSMERAILGGGDIAFPLIFAGAVMKTSGFTGAAIIPPFAAVGLFILLYKSKKGMFYPAMPFISAGCIAGYVVLALLNLIL